MKVTDMAALIAIAGAGYLLYRGYKSASGAASAAAQVVATSLNPASPENLVYTGVNDVGALVTQQPAGSFSLGASIWDWLHPAQVAAETQVTSGTVPAPAPAPASVSVSTLPTDTSVYTDTLTGMGG